MTPESRPWLGASGVCGCRKKDSKSRSFFGKGSIRITPIRVLVVTILAKMKPPVVSRLLFALFYLASLAHNNVHAVEFHATAVGSSFFPPLFCLPVLVLLFVKKSILCPTALTPMYSFSPVYRMPLHPPSLSLSFHFFHVHTPSLPLSSIR